MKQPVSRLLQSSPGTAGGGDSGLKKRGTRHSETEEGRFVRGWVWDQGAIAHQIMSAGPGTLLSLQWTWRDKIDDPVSALGGQSLVGDQPVAAGASRAEHGKP